MFAKRAMRASIASSLVAGTVASGLALAQPGPPQQCAIDAATFRTWQAQSQSPGTLSFQPPNSTTFISNPNNCSFYQWASQMALWLMSTDKAGNLTMFSPVFYNEVASWDSSGTEHFTLVQNSENAQIVAGGLRKPNISFRVRVNKPVARTRRVRVAGATANSGSPGETGQADGNVLVFNGQPVFVSGNSGPATYPIVYYAVLVNDVNAALQQNYAHVSYFNQVKAGDPGNFPITADQVAEIATAAKATFPDANQMALEMKTSWVDTSYLSPAQVNGLLTIAADVPTFTQSTNSAGNLVLTPTGQTTERKLALVGIHVVGTVAGHPEMVWATFESVFNSPDAAYAYVNSAGALTTVPFSGGSAGQFIFYPGGNQLPTSITPSASFAGTTAGSVITFNSSSLAPTTVARLNPWGNQQPAQPSASDPVVRNNTDLVLLNQSLAALLKQQQANGPVLANYFQVGAIWSHGAIPSGPTDNTAGSHYLANTTMETFQQSTSNPQNCFSCHFPFTPSPPSAGTGVSHVFPFVAPQSR